MRHMLQALIILAAATMLSSCAVYYNAVVPKHSDNIVKAKYLDNVELMQHYMEDDTPASSCELTSLCYSYFMIKDYRMLNKCLEIQKRRYDKGDKTCLLADIKIMIDLLHAKSRLEMGYFDEVSVMSEKYLDDNTDMRKGPHIEWLEVFGISSALSGNNEKSIRAIKQLESIYLGYPFNLLQAHRDTAETKIYLAMKMYKEAYDTSSRFSPFADFTKAVAGATYTSAEMFLFQELPNKFMHAKSAFLSGHTKESTSSYDALLSNDRIKSDGNIYWQALYDRGQLYETAGQIPFALSMYMNAIDVIEHQRNTIGNDTSKIGFVGDKQALYQSMVEALIRQGQHAQAFEYVERGKSRALVDLLADRQKIAGQGSLTDASAVLAQLAELDQKNSNPGGGAQNDKTQLRSALSNAKDQIRQAAPELASLVTVSAPKAQDIQAQLAPDETLLEYYGQGDTLYAFVVTREGIKAQKLDAKGLEKNVRLFREQIKDVSKNTYLPLAQAFYDKLIRPVPGALEKPRLIVVSHGALHYLPFSALHDGQQFLVDKVTLQLLPSASVMPFLAARKPATAKDMLLLGNPDLGKPDMDLPGAEAEAQAIRGIWPGSTVLTRKAATKGALAKAGQLFKVIHVAAHGEFQADQPLASRLLLAPEGSDDGLLTAGDLYGMRLNADLVTLSACETGMGKVLNGDDVVGLTRGFLYAGANSIVASLWPVSDDETKFLMTSFYTNLRNRPKAEALRQAQLDTKRKYSHPFFWSAFQLTGVGRAGLAGSSSPAASVAYQAPAQQPVAVQPAPIQPVAAVQRSASAPAPVTLKASEAHPPAPQPAETRPTALPVQAPVQTAAVQPPVVKPSAPTPATPSSGKYSVHVASYNSDNELESGIAKWSALGKSITYKDVDIPGKGRWFRLLVGSFATKAEAEAYGRELKAKGLTSYYQVQ